jgi:uncharacterized protein (TIGR03083 family)
VNPLPPVNAVPLFPEERGALLDVLTSLDDAACSKETSCPGWSVKDISSHLLSDDLGRLSRGRDRHLAGLFVATPEGAPPGAVVASSPQRFEPELLDFINRQNEAWVEATRRLSARVVTDLLRWSGEETQRYWESLDLEAIGMPVSWAGPEPAPVWLDVAREFTERWLHQAQIRAAAGAPPLYEARFFVPVLDTFVRALPHTYRHTDAPEGTHVSLVILAPEPTDDPWRLQYSLVRRGGAWHLLQPFDSDPDASVTIDGDTAWRLFTKGIGRPDAVSRSVIEGERALAEKLFDTVAIIA